MDIRPVFKRTARDESLFKSRVSADRSQRMSNGAQASLPAPHSIKEKYKLRNNASFGGREVFSKYGANKMPVAVTKRLTIATGANNENMKKKSSSAPLRPLTNFQNLKSRKEGQRSISDGLKKSTLSRWQGTPLRVREARNRLRSPTYWLSQIKLAETAGEHGVSVGLYQLAFGCVSESQNDLRKSFTSYKQKHNIPMDQLLLKDASLTISGAVDNDKLDVVNIKEPQNAAIQKKKDEVKIDVTGDVAASMCKETLDAASIDRSSSVCIANDDSGTSDKENSPYSITAKSDQCPDEKTIRNLYDEYYQDQIEEKNAMLDITNDGMGSDQSCKNTFSGSLETAHSVPLLNYPLDALADTAPDTHVSKVNAEDDLLAVSALEVHYKEQSSQNKVVKGQPQKKYDEHFDVSEVNVEDKDDLLAVNASEAQAKEQSSQNKAVKDMSQNKSDEHFDISEVNVEVKDGLLSGNASEAQTKEKSSQNKAVKGRSHKKSDENFTPRRTPRRACTIKRDGSQHGDTDQKLNTCMETGSSVQYDDYVSTFEIQEVHSGGMGQNDATLLESEAIEKMDVSSLMKEVVSCIMGSSLDEVPNDKLEDGPAVQNLGIENGLQNIELMSPQICKDEDICIKTPIQTPTTRRSGRLKSDLKRSAKFESVSAIKDKSTAKKETSVRKSIDNVIVKSLNLRDYSTKGKLTIQGQKLKVADKDGSSEDVQQALRLSINEISQTPAASRTKELSDVDHSDRSATSVRKTKERVPISSGCKRTPCGEHSKSAATPGSETRRSARLRSSNTPAK